jgi:hypothetical protein
MIKTITSSLVLLGLCAAASAAPITATEHILYAPSISTYAAVGIFPQRGIYKVTCQLDKPLPHGQYIKVTYTDGPSISPSSNPTALGEYQEGASTYTADPVIVNGPVDPITSKYTGFYKYTGNFNLIRGTCTYTLESPPNK